ncbi:CDP-diacylglycerol--serine O-phosphatidyltransferase [Marinimicrobium alkaliphilum]|uniref:CDP-diacylglycerol--serine O-phosphatidyltransferase n=1 Tax=Marinimicrobium alkaliphilum TaxID=2202654 RepID=UPI000DBA4C96|nr:CDP-diacylglycerol--serine O-phosphatidyltransferase [Marinimicrobium alkaliphilum]
MTMTDEEREQAGAGENTESLLPFGEHVEEVSENGKKVRHRGVYLLPNLFTTGALFGGFYAIIAAMDGSYAAAAIAIFIAMVLDGLDGRVARLTNTSSAFGEQYDSLADMVSFGLAPALVMFSWALGDLGKIGWAAAFIYTACAALRLARFNTQIGSVDKRYFIGLASPSAAAIIAGVVWIGSSAESDLLTAMAAAIITPLVGLLMVSNFRYSSFKGLDLRGRVPFVVMLAVVFVFVIVTLHPPLVLLTGFVLYGLSGPAVWTWRRRESIQAGWQRWRARKNAAEADEDA